MEIDRLEAPYPSDCLGVDISEAADYTVYSELYNVKYDIHVSVLRFITICYVCGTLCKISMSMSNPIAWDPAMDHT